MLESLFWWSLFICEFFVAGALVYDCWKLLVEKKILSLSAKRIDREIVTMLWPVFCIYAIVKLLEVVLFSSVFELIIVFRRMYHFLNSRV